MRKLPGGISPAGGAGDSNIEMTPRLLVPALIHWGFNVATTKYEASNTVHV
jgi:hypothetical protein